MTNYKFTGSNSTAGMTGSTSAAGLTETERALLARHGIPTAKYLEAKRKAEARRTGRQLSASAESISDVTLSATDEKFLAQHPTISREQFLEDKRTDAIPEEHRESVREMELTAKSGIVLDDVERQIANRMPGGLEAYCRGVERQQEVERKAVERKTRIETSPELTATDKEWLLRHPDQDVDRFLKAAAEEKKQYHPPSMVSGW